MQASNLLENLNKVENLFSERTINYCCFFCSHIELHEQYYESLTGKKVSVKRGQPCTAVSNLLSYIYLALHVMVL